jgi:alpha-tubulin suppressor-like RCC1 family protein
VKAIAAGTQHTISLLEDGSVRSWGVNNLGQCTAPSDLGAVKTISAGGVFNLAVIVACPADLNRDHAVNGSDLGLLLTTWGRPGIGDINSDGTVNGLDIGDLIAAWGSCQE